MRFKTRDLVIATLLPMGFVTVPQTKLRLVFWRFSVGGHDEQIILILRFLSWRAT